MTYSVCIGANNQKARQMKAEISSIGPPVRGSLVGLTPEKIAILSPSSNNGVWLSFLSPGAPQWRYDLELLSAGGQFTATPRGDSGAWRELNPLGD